MIDHKKGMGMEEMVLVKGNEAKGEEVMGWKVDMESEEWAEEVILENFQGKIQKD